MGVCGVCLKNRIRHIRCGFVPQMAVDTLNAPASDDTWMPCGIRRSEPDRIALEGPHSRLRELWLVLRALRDFIAGFRALHFVGPDDLDTVVAHIERHSVQHFGLRRQPRPSRWLGESTVRAGASR